MRASGRIVCGAVLAGGLVVGGISGAEDAKRAPDVAAAPPARVLAEQAGLLPEAKPGQCFAKVREPARYEAKLEKVVTREASEKIEVVPAAYEWVEETVVVREASTKLIEAPAVYETQQEQVEVAPAREVWRVGLGDAPIASAGLITLAAAAGLPAQAKPGECFAEYQIPARFEDKQEKLLKRAAAEKIEIVPARYEWVEQKVLVREASEKLEEVPAVYETVTEQVLDEPAHTAWKKGRGPAERVDNSTGEILCLVEVPATYKTVTKRVLKSPAATRKLTLPAEHKTVRVHKLVEPAKETRSEIPAEYQTLTRQVKLSDEKITWASAAPEGSRRTGRELCRAALPARFKSVTKQVVKTPATVVKQEIPAETQQVRVRKLVSAAQEKRSQIPAEYAEVERRVKVAEEQLAWRPVLCETNTSRELVTQIQQALQQAGLDPGPIDGEIGSQTLAALDAYQQKQGLARGGLTTATLQQLGISIGQ